MGNKEESQYSKWMIVFTLVLAAVLLYLAFRGVDWQEFRDTLQQSRIEFLLVSFGIISVSVFLRGLRWRELLRAEARLPMRLVFWSTSIGYLGNSFLPARAGEIIRSTLIGHHARISKSYVLATALTERIIDAVFLIIVSLTSLAFITDNIPEWVSAALLASTVVAVGGLIVLLVAHRFQTNITDILTRLPLPKNLQLYSIALIDQFIQGTTAFQHKSRLLRFLGLTCLIWFLDVISAMMVATAFDMVITNLQTLFLVAALSLSSAVPSTPGYLGVYQFVSVTILGAFGIEQALALAFIIAFQGISYSVFILWGTLGFWRLNYGQTSTHQSF